MSFMQRRSRLRGGRRLGDGCACRYRNGRLKDAAPAGASFEDVPAAGLQAKSYAGVEQGIWKWLSQSEKLELLRQRDLKLTSNPGESERDFQIRVQDAQRVARDAAVDALTKKYVQAAADRRAKTSRSGVC